MVGAFAHGAIFLIRDYDPKANENNVLYRMLEHKEALISHLSWVSLFLGFHTLGLYVHNDVVVAFGTPEKQILVEPVFAQWIQAATASCSTGLTPCCPTPTALPPPPGPTTATSGCPVGWMPSTVG
jgi:photosystem I P700 chlorophyll a apoprotein A2